MAGRYVPLPAGVFAVLAIAALGAGILTFRRPHLHAGTVAAAGAAIFSLSAVYAQSSYYALSGNHVVTYAADFPVPVTVRGQIVSSPMKVEDDARDVLPYRRPPRTVFLIECREIETAAAPGRDAQATNGSNATAWLPCDGLARVTVREEAAQLAAGQEVELIGVLSRFRRPDNPGEVDWSEQSRRGGVLAMVSVPAADGAIVRSPAGKTWVSRAWWNLRSGVRQHLGGFGDVEEGRLLNALLTGERHPALQTLNQAMVRSGTAHFLSISGQHLVIFLGFVYLICRLARLNPRRAAAAVLVLLAGYLLLAEPNPPLHRSAIMAACVCLAVLAGRQHSALNAVAAATVIILAFQPLELFSAGFQLSFGIVAGMIVLHGPLRDSLFDRWLRRRGLTVFRDDEAVRRWLYFTAGNAAITLIVASLSASFVSMPLVAYHFGLLSPYAPVLSVLLSPLVTAVLVPGYLSMALAWPMPHLSAALGNLSATAADWLMAAVRAADLLPGLCFHLQPVGLAWTVLFFVMVSLALLAKGLPWRRAALAVVTAGWVGLTVWTQMPSPAPDWAELNVLAVGHGQCIVLRTPSGKTWLFDAGSIGSVDVARQILGPFLRDRRMPMPREVWISHPNSDHYNAVAPLLEQCPLRVCHISDYFDKPSRTGQPPDAGMVALLADMVRQGVQIVSLQQGQSLQLDARTRLDVIWPPPGKGFSANDASLVLKVTCDDKSVLLTGDIEAEAQKEIAANKAATCDVLLLPHHGSYRSTLNDMVQQLSPSMVIVSAGHPMRIPVGQDQAADFLSRLQHGRTYYSTARNGYIRIVFGRGRLSAETMR